MDNLAAIAAADQERLFGEGVDLFKNYFAVLGIRNILKVIGVNTSTDSDWFRAVANFITTSELSEMYDKILSPERRRNLAASRTYRTPPEINEDDPDDIISYLSKNIVHRKKMWRIAAQIYEKRKEEYQAALAQPNRVRSAVENRFNEMKDLFSLNEKEMHLLMAVFLSETRFVELGDFDINRYRSGEKVSTLARILGILDVEAAELLS
ncbi:MAG: hypothetical protein J5858_11035, partial [Lentisphaeria bacterium]|nr:hypothetical protein [Lentisphaeria bacterium]